VVNFGATNGPIIIQHEFRNKLHSLLRERTEFSKRND